MAVTPSLVNPADLIVGFDGSEPATRALDWAQRILTDRPGTLHVVYVNPPHASAGMYGMGMAEELDAEDAVVADLQKTVDAKLAGTALSWSFERRDGGVVDHLVSVASERLASAPEGTDTVLVVGRSAHAVHKVVGSVPVGLLHHSPVPVVTIP